MFSGLDGPILVVSLHRCQLKVWWQHHETGMIQMTSLLAASWCWLPAERQAGTTSATFRGVCLLACASHPFSTGLEEHPNHLNSEAFMCGHRNFDHVLLVKANTSSHWKARRATQVQHHQPNTPIRVIHSKVFSSSTCSNYLIYKHQSEAFWCFPFLLIKCGRWRLTVRAVPRVEIAS